MSTLYITTDSCGLPNWKLPANDPSQPRMIGVGWAFDEPGWEPVYEIIRPAGPSYRFDPTTVGINHISEQTAMSRGKALGVVLHHLEQAVMKATRVAAFNWSYHQRLIDGERVRAELMPQMYENRPRCLMRDATPMVKIQRQQPGGGYLFPKLPAAYQYFTGGLPLWLPDDPEQRGMRMLLAIQAIDHGILRELREPITNAAAHS